MTRLLKELKITMKKNNTAPDSVQRLVGEEKINIILDTIYFRISSVLTEKDMEEIKNLDKKDPTGEETHSYIKTKVPNIEEIIEEEVKRSKKDQTASS